MTNPIADIIERAKALLFKARAERELAEELRDHVARDAEARTRAGSPDGHREALAALGGIERVREEVREARGTLSLEELAADTRYALRALRRNIGFTIAVVAVLGVGIGAATVVFTVVNRVFLAGLPYPDANRLVRIYEKNPPANLWTLSVVDIQAINSQQRVFDAFGAAQWGTASLAGAGTPERISVVRVTSGFFKALGVRAVRGRLLEAADDVPGAPLTVVVSSALADRSLGGAASATGKAITLDGRSYSVVGVLEPGRNDLAGMRAEAWPVMQLGTPNRRGPFGYRGYARMKQGVTLAVATSELAGISERVFPIWKSSFQDSIAKLTPVPLRDAIVGHANTQLDLFAGAVALVLLLTIANVATLMLVRISAREHELSVRTALGAGRRRIVRLIVTECVALTALSGAVGLVLTGLSLKFVGWIMPDLPRLAEVKLDLRSVAFVAIASLVAGLLVSLAPVASALARASSSGEGLVGSPLRTGPGRRANTLRGALVVAEFAVALPLLMGAGLLFNSFLRLERVDPGFNPDGVYAVALALPSTRYSSTEKILDFWRRAETRARETAGVASAGLSGSLPPDTFGDVNNFDLLDKPTPAGSTQPVAPWPTVTNGYFAAMGIALLEGRAFTLADSATAPPVVVVSHAWAVRYYPHTSAVGKQLYGGGCTTCPPTTVIGVVGDVKYSGLAEESDAVYAPLSQSADNSLNLVVRSKTDATSTFRALRSVVAALDPEIAPTQIVLADRVDEALGDPRRWTTIISAFAVTGVVLAALGIFGLMSYVVRQRRREMGVRVALGADPGSLVRLVVGRGMRYALLGTAIGLAATVFESRWLGSMLFHVRATDPATLAAAIAVLLAIAALACWVPGVRAARVKPVEALSTE